MTGKLIFGILGFVVVGAPVVYVIWSWVNELLLGRFDASRAVVAVPAIAVFAGILFVVARYVWRVNENG